MAINDSVACGNPVCEKTWERDPIYEVACPHCGAGVGQACKRPSGHDAFNIGNQKFHSERDLKALEEGKYGSCPQGECPSSPDEIDDVLQQTA